MFTISACFRTWVTYASNVYSSNFSFFPQISTMTRRSGTKTRTRMSHPLTARMQFRGKTRLCPILRKQRGNREDPEVVAQPQKRRSESWVASRLILKNGRGWRLFSDKASFSIAGVYWSPIGMFLPQRIVFTGKQTICNIVIPCNAKPNGSRKKV